MEKQKEQKSLFVNGLEKQTSCNTIIEKLSVPSRARKWCFTWCHHSKKNVEELLEYFGACPAYVFQEEIGMENKTPHLQGVVNFGGLKLFTALLKAFGGKVHWERCRNWKGSIAYCSAIDKRFGKIWSRNVCLKVQTPDRFDQKKIMLWQSVVLKIICEEPNNRTVYWFWEPIGRTGKSTLALHMILKRNSYAMSGAAKDCAFGIKSLLDRGKFVKSVIFDVSRSRYNTVNYEVIENLKNGFMYSPKYESGLITFPPLHIFVFANARPNIHELSLDRWKIYRIRRGWEKTPLQNVGVVTKATPGITHECSSSDEDMDVPSDDERLDSLSGNPYGK